MNEQPPNANIDVAELRVPELVAVLRNDTDAYPSAGRVEVPAALEELRRRARVTDDTEGPVRIAEGRLAARALEELDLAEADRDLAELEAAATADPGPLDGAHPHNDRILAANGFAVVREKCMTAAATVPPPAAIEAAVRYAKASRAQALAKGAPRQQIDGLDAEVAQLEAVAKFGRALRAIVEKFEARAQIAGGDA